MGRMVRLTPEEMENLVPVTVRDEMPDDPEFGALRFTLKNFTNRPEQMRQVLRAHEYHVRPYGGGWNFAVQKMQKDENGDYMPPDPNQWRVVDPENYNDLLYDLTDWFGEMMVGSATTVGGILGGPVGAGLGAAAGEFGRELAGSALGIEDNIDPIQIGITGAVGGVAGPASSLVGRGVSAIGRKVAPAIGNLGLELGARIAGLRNSPGLLATEALNERAESMGRRFVMPAAIPGTIGRTLRKGETPEAMELVDILRAKLDYVGQFGFQEKLLSGAMRAANAKTYIPIGRATWKFLRTNPILTTDDASEAANSRVIIDRLMTILNVPTRKTVQIQMPLAQAAQQGFVKTVRLGKTLGGNVTINQSIRLTAGERLAILRQTQPSIPQAHAILSKLDDYVARRGGYDPIRKYKLDAFTRRAKDAARELRTEINQTLGLRYQYLNTRTHVKTMLRNNVRRHVGEGREGAEAYLEKFFEMGKSEQSELLKNFDRMFGTEFYPAIRLAGVGSRFGVRVNPFTGDRFAGKPSWLPKLAATGQFLGTNLFAGGTIFGGYVVGGVPGVVAGAGLASPRGIVTATRIAKGATSAAHSLAAGGRSGAGYIAGSSRNLAAASIAASSRELVNRMAPDKPVAHAGALQRSKSRTLRIR